MLSIKNGHLIGRHNDVTTNMAALAVCMCLAASHLLDTSRSWVFQAQRALAQKFTVIFWCEGIALAIGILTIYVSFIRVLWLSALGAAESPFSMVK